MRNTVGFGNLALAAGTKLGPYEILSPLGAGGMGEVYRARDGKLNREVAIKVLPELFAADPERLARFQREAQVLASLNHPHIAAIYGLEKSGNVEALVLELVEGETLADRIAAGPIPIDEALAIARQIADALEAAHEKGIVHRDLKPANVKLTPEGKVKVLDFGLAKAFTKDSSSPEVSHSPTLTAAATQAGVVIGTAAYMSPEQARGKPVDKRTDIWAFGAVLYEMLTGRKVFEGETVSDTLAAILKTEPNWMALPAATPVSVRRLLKRCLERESKRRLHDIADARLEIDTAAEEPAVTMPETSNPTARGARPWALAAVALLAAGLAALLTWRLAPHRAESQAPVVTKLARLTRDGAASEWPTWSADGALLAFANNRSGNFEIYVRRGEGGEDVNTTKDDAQDVQPAFSPDGNTIAFVSTRSSRTGLIKIGGTYGRNVRTYGGDLWVEPALGGAARRLASDANFPAWRPDGKGILYVSGPENRRSILEVPSGGGSPQTILSSATSTWEISRIACSPNGSWISVEIQPEGILLMPASGGKPGTVLAEGFGHAWDSSSGRVYFIHRNLHGGNRIQFIELSAGGEAAGRTPVTISLVTSDMMELAIAHDGLRIAVPELEASRNLTRLPLAPGGGSPAGPEEPLTSGNVTDSYPSVSPDGRRVALVSDKLGHMDVAILDVQSRRRERLQLPGEDVAQVSPVWMPDGRQLLLSRSGAGTSSSNWIVALDGSRADQLFSRTAQGAWTINPSPDGKRLLYVDRTGGVQQAFAFDFETRKSTQVTDSPGDKFDALYSPDGKWIAVTGAKDGALQLFRMPTAGGPMQQLTTGYERMRHPFYSPDGKWIYVQPSHRNIYRVKAEGGPLEQVTHFPDAGLFLEEPTISPDGRYLYYCRGNGGSSLWLMTLENQGRPR
ncbi:MAG: protein kinase [Acidobacteriota bacterium]